MRAVRDAPVRVVAVGELEAVMVGTAARVVKL
jgi:hypothetical protein